jgi:hypothetical protein
MNCKEARESFSDYLDQRLTLSRLALIREHIKICLACAGELEDLRETVALIGSLDEIEPAPDFLAQVNGKIDGGSIAGRLRRWVFEPAGIKLPLEAAALFAVTTLALYVYHRSPQPVEDRLLLSRNSSESVGSALSEYGLKRPVPSGEPSVGAGKAPSASSKGEIREAAKQGAAAPGGAAPDTDRAARRETPPPKQEATEASNLSAQSEPFRRANSPAELVEVQAEDVSAFETRLNALLPNLGGKITGRHVSEDGLVLAIELPRSREAQFHSAVKKEISAGSPQEALAKRKSAKLQDEPSSRVVLPAAPRVMSQEKMLVAEQDGPSVTIELRLRAKK